MDKTMEDLKETVGHLERKVVKLESRLKSGKKVDVEALKSLNDALRIADGNHPAW